MIEIPVKLVLLTEKSIQGVIHLPEEQRLSDVLNDDRAFIPVYVLYLDGEPAKLKMINKQQILIIEEV